MYTTTFNNPFKSFIIADNLKILIVDDFYYNLFVLEEIMNSLGINKIDKAYNGAQALQMVNKQYIKEENHYDFIFLDINMPVMDGMECAK